MTDYVISKNIREWPRGFLDSLFGDPNAMAVLPSDFDGSLAYALGTLDQRTREMIYDRYRDRMILDDIASKHHVTRERVRQILAKGMRLLRHPYRLRFIQYGVAAVLIYEKGEAANRARMRAGADAIRQYKIEQAINEKAAQKEGKAALYDTFIGELDLSVRAHNCLLRAGCESIGDILALDAAKLMQIRCLGVKTHNEIVDKLESMGFDVLHLRRQD